MVEGNAAGIEYCCRVTAFASATGLGSWPGVTPREAAAVVVGELHRLTHVVELPARGVGADMIGRAGALLVDIGIDTVPRGYRISSRGTSAVRRATSLLGEDVDALEEAWEVAGLKAGDRSVKVQAPGPITLAAQLELANGHRAITDSGALRDLTESLAEGVATHRDDVARRLGLDVGDVHVQFDEPLLSAALEGRLTGVTGVTPVHPVDEAVATSLLDECAARLGGPVALHSCAAALPWKVLQRSTLHAISVDVTTLKAADLDQIGEFIQSDRVIMLGVVPATAPAAPPTVSDVAAAASSITDRLGFDRSVLRDRVGITPACGLAGATPQWARTAVELAQQVADRFATDPDG